MSKKLPNDPRRIAFWTGNLSLRNKVYISALFQQAKDVYPLARTDLIAPQDVLAFFKNVENVDQLVQFSSEQGFFPGLRHARQFAKVLKARKYDLMFF